ncbi:MAG: ion transporter [Acidobacteria bacterium]|nr:MAG: ion transporter [Acidobacteriota bacterium]
MTEEPADKIAERNRLGFLNILIVVLSIYVLVALVIDTFFKLNPELSRLLSLIDDFICGVFLIDFCIRFYRAESKREFMKWGWIDLLSSIPTLQYFRVGRALRLFRLLRVLRAFRSIRDFANHVFRHRVQGAFSSVAIIAVLMVIFSSVAILQVEDDPNSNIKTAGDALWWSYVTITTVGYGDKYPVTAEGRIIAAVLMTVGAGLVGTFTGFAASWFVEGRMEEQEEEEERERKKKREERKQKKQQKKAGPKP